MQVCCVHALILCIRCALVFSLYFALKVVSCVITYKLELVNRVILKPKEGQELVKKMGQKGDRTFQRMIPQHSTPNVYYLPPTLLFLLSQRKEIFVPYTFHLFLLFSLLI